MNKPTPLRVRVPSEPSRSPFKSTTQKEHVISETLIDYRSAVHSIVGSASLIVYTNIAYDFEKVPKKVRKGTEKYEG